LGKPAITSKASFVGLAASVGSVGMDFAGGIHKALLFIARKTIEKTEKLSITIH